MLVNSFIITPKVEWRDEACYARVSYAMEMESVLPERYRPLFSTLIKDISLNELIDNKDHRRAYEIMAQATLSGKENGVTWVSRKGDSLQHVIRRTFYDTLFIIRNDYNPFKYDQFMVVLSKDVISEEQWEGLYLKNGIAPPSNGKVVTGNFPKIEAI